MTSDDQARSILSDVQGTTVASVNGTSIVPGDLVDPFGNGTTTGNRWAGGRRDQTGLVDRRLRDYDPSLSTFISEDPSGVSGGFNLYAYTGGDPLNRIDPMGLSFLSSALDVAQDFGVGVANGVTFGTFGQVTGLKTCGIAGMIGSWVGSGILAYATGGVAQLGLAYTGLSEASAAIGGGMVGGAIASVAQSRATGQALTPLSVGMGAFSGGGAAWVQGGFVHLPTQTRIEVWKHQRIPSMATSGVDLLSTLFGPGAGGSRKC